MPNHVHVVVEPMDGHTLSTIAKSWKSITSRQANARLDRTGPFWGADYFDRYMRNEDHVVRTIEYVENNPVKAGLVKEAVECHGVQLADNLHRSADLQGLHHDS